MCLDSIHKRLPSIHYNIIRPSHTKAHQDFMFKRSTAFIPYFKDKHLTLGLICRVLCLKEKELQKISPSIISFKTDIWYCNTSILTSVIHGARDKNRSAMPLLVQDYSLKYIFYFYVQSRFNYLKWGFTFIKLEGCSLVVLIHYHLLFVLWQQLESSTEIRIPLCNVLYEHIAWSNFSPEGFTV